MKWDRISTYGLLSLLFIVDAILLFRVFRLQEEVILKDRIIDKITMSQYLAEDTATNLNVNYRYGGLSVGDCETEDHAENRCPLKRIVRQPTLVFRYCDRACSECISFGADKLARELEGSNIPVVFLARYDNIQEMRRQGPVVNPWGFRMLNVKKVLDLDERLIPYYCIIDERGIIHDIFIPEKSHPSTTNQYLVCIKDKYGNR